MTMTPTLAEVLQVAMDEYHSDVWVALPGRVESYDATTRKASVAPITRRAYSDEDGTRVAERLPVVPDVPVLFPGAGAFSITWPLSVGDTGLLVFTSASLDVWLATGASDVDPNDARRSTLTDGVFLPGLRPFASPGSATHATAMVLESSGEIHAGGTAALATKADLDALKTAITNTTISAGDGGTSFKTTLLTALGSWPVGTTKLKGS